MNETFVLPGKLEFKTGRFCLLLLINRLFGLGTGAMELRFATRFSLSPLLLLFPALWIRILKGLEATNFQACMIILLSQKQFGAEVK